MRNCIWIVYSLQCRRRMTYSRFRNFLKSFLEMLLFHLLCPGGVFSVWRCVSDPQINITVLERKFLTACFLKYVREPFLEHRKNFFNSPPSEYILIQDFRRNLLLLGYSLNHLFFSVLRRIIYFLYCEKK